MTTHADRAAPDRGAPRTGPAHPRSAGTLHVLDGPDRGRAWPLAAGTHLLGGSPHCDLTLTDPDVARWHCMIAVTSHTPGRPATVTVEDRGSHTGTLVNGRPAGRPSVLTPGARIAVGRTTLGWAPAGWKPAASPAPGSRTPPERPGGGATLLDEATVVIGALSRLRRAPAPAPAPAAAPAPPQAPATVQSPVPAPATPVAEPAAEARKPKRWLRSAAPERPAHRSTLLATLTILLALATLAGAGALTNLPLLFPPLAASMALIAAGRALPLAQPRNVLGGHVVSALIGFTAVAVIGAGGWAAALAGACALAAMLVLRMSHSPAVGTAVIVGATAPSVLQFMELLVLAGIILVAFGVIGAQLEGKKYPVYWW
jgi:hypothetical protein